MNRPAILLTYGSQSPRWRRFVVRVGVVVTFVSTFLIAGHLQLFDSYRACGNFPVNVRVVGAPYKQMNYVTAQTGDRARSYAEFMMEGPGDSPKAAQLNGSTSQIQVPVSFVKDCLMPRERRQQPAYAEIAITLLDGHVVTRTVKLPNNSNTPVLVTIDKVEPTSGG